MQKRKILEYALAAAGNVTSHVIARKLPDIHVLTYHSVHSVGWHPIVVSTDDFREQMSMLAESYTPVGLGALEAYLINNRPLPQRAVAVTFDDGYLDNLTEALPILQEFGIPATVFVTLCHMEKADKIPGTLKRAYCNAEEVRKLSEADITIGAHGTHHSPFANLDPAEIDMQAAKCRQVLQELTGQPIRYLAFPFGRADTYTKRNIVSVKEAGYAMAFSNRYGGIFSNDDRFQLRRIQVGNQTDTFLLRRRLNGDLDALRHLESGPGLAFRKMYGKLRETKLKPSF